MAFINYVDIKVFPNVIDDLKNLDPQQISEKLLDENIIKYNVNLSQVYAQA